MHIFMSRVYIEVNIFTIQKKSIDDEKNVKD